MNQHHKISYLELPARDLPGTKAFFSQVFGWEFTDYGPEYTCFTNGGMPGGFYKAGVSACTDKGSVLMVMYSEDLSTTQTKVEKAGGKVIKPIFSFPGGRRFHFSDPSGNEYAVWSH
ncbi:VOC family protein [Aliiglaciecola sp. CAU 1673]|uniref:VOC family protein n=1 Tax=Aliiglaciecola sp. CAU 1673 TaxID=3032595 RepID=UPI0023D9A7C6|nr:VOC family protein [Aliiglaciecola sp. CAU 1673]MDF2179441.1 VOC family protein [Aliiglaciecola sp. CAU 1673]